MATRTITVHDKCTTPNCGRTLHSISEGERGLCASCWVKGLKPETRAAMNRLIRAAFDGSDEIEKGSVVKDAIERLRADRAAK